MNYLSEKSIPYSPNYIKISDKFDEDALESKSITLKRGLRESYHEKVVSNHFVSFT